MQNRNGRKIRGGRLFTTLLAWISKKLVVYIVWGALPTWGVAFLVYSLARSDLGIPSAETPPRQCCRHSAPPMLLWKRIPMAPHIEVVCISLSCWLYDAKYQAWCTNAFYIFVSGFLTTCIFRRTYRLARGSQCQRTSEPPTATSKGTHVSGCFL
jgi:hypothetical protein